MATGPLSLEELLEQSRWLRRLAHSLVASEETAEDLVQETWLAALRRPPRAGGPARPWLGRVARQLASNFRRAEARRREHEAGASRAESAFDPSSATAELETQRFLAEAVLRLEEPLRSAIVLRYVRGLDSAAIARLQGAPAGTVRWRLKRALELLRIDLDRRSGGDRQRWCSALTALAAEWTAAPATAPSPAGAGFTGAKATAGVGLALTSLLVLSVAYALVNGGEARRRDGVSGATAVGPRDSAVARFELAEPAAPSERAASAVAEIASTRAATPARSRAPRRHGPIRGRLHIAGTEEPLDEVLTIRLRTGDLSLKETVVTAPDGSFASTTEFPRAFVLATVMYPTGDVADEYDALFEPASGAEWNVPVRWPTFVRGRTLDRDGSPLRGVRLSLSGIGDEGEQIASETRAGGEVRIDGLEPGIYTLVLQKNFARSERRLIVRRGPNELGDLVVACEERVGEISGELRCQGGAPPDTVLLTERSGNLVALAHTTARGRNGPTEFRFEGVPLGEYLLAPLSHGGYRYEPESVRVSPPETGVVFEAVGKRETLAVRWPDDLEDAELLARVRGRWLVSAEGLALADVERWIALSRDHRPAAGDPPESGALDVRLEPGWGHAFLFVEAGGDPDFPGHSGVAGEPLTGVEVIADGRCVARSDDSGLALGDLAGAPDSVAFRARAWRVHSTHEEGGLTVVEMTRE